MPGRDPRDGRRSSTSLLTVALALASVIALGGCGEHRPLGDTDGLPVSFVLHLDAGYLDGMSVVVPTAPPVFFEPDPWYGASSRFRYYGRGPYGRSPFLADPFWSEPGFTAIVLTGGDAPREAGLFRAPISVGDNRFTVRIRPGRVVTLTVQVRGGREGWETIGHFESADRPGQSVDISLTADGPKMAVVAPPSTPSAAPADAAPRSDETATPR